MAEQPKKQKYVVVTKGFSMSILDGKDLPVGATVELTERQANAFAGKVQLKTSFDDLNKATDSVAALQKDNEQLRKQVAELQKEVAELKKAK